MPVPVPTLTPPRGPGSCRAGPPAPAGARASADSVASGGPGLAGLGLGSESTIDVKAVQVRPQRSATPSYYHKNAASEKTSNSEQTSNPSRFKFLILDVLNARRVSAEFQLEGQFEPMVSFGI